MKKTAIFYGSSSGVTEDVAGRIAGKLGIDSADVYNVGEASVADVDAYEVLLLGSSTWGIGDLQDDWEGFLLNLKKHDLSGKVVALFGTGDGYSYSDSFCDAIGIIYQELQGSGCRFIGSVDRDGYEFDESKAFVSGKFVGLPIDDSNQDDKTEARIDNWVEQLRKEYLG